MKCSRSTARLRTSTGLSIWLTKKGRSSYGSIFDAQPQSSSTCTGRKNLIAASRQIDKKTRGVSWQRKFLDTLNFRSLQVRRILATSWSSIGPAWCQHYAVLQGIYARTQNSAGMIIPVVITVFGDRFSPSSRRRHRRHSYQERSGIEDY